MDLKTQFWAKATFELYKYIGFIDISPTWNGIFLIYNPIHLNNLKCPFRKYIASFFYLFMVLKIKSHKK